MARGLRTKHDVIDRYRIFQKGTDKEIPKWGKPGEFTWGSYS